MSEALGPAGPGSDATWRGGRDEMRSDCLWKGRIGGTGYAARGMARQVKWADPALRRERERERERERRSYKKEREREREKERTRVSGRRTCEKGEREKERVSESENERREHSREEAREVSRDLQLC